MGMIKLPKQSIEFFKENVDEIFESGALAEGKWNKEVSSFVEEYCSVSSAIPVASNGSGMVTLLQIYNEYHGRENAFIQSNTMYGVKTMIKSGSHSLAGFVDCSPETLMPTLDDVKKSVENYSGDKSKLTILLTHIGGIVNPDIVGIAEYCKDNNIILLEDCAHSFGSTLNGKHSGTFGDGGAYSFYATKAIPGGEGGVIVTKHKDIGDMAKKFVIYDRFDQELNIGINVRMSELQALLVFAVVKEVEEIIKNKTNIAELFIAKCKEKSISYISQNTEGQRGNYYKFMLLDPGCNVSEVFKKITKKTSPVYDYVLGESKDVATSHICLPIWYGQDDEITNDVLKELDSL